MILGVIGWQRRLYLAAKPSDVGADVDGLAFSLHRPTVYNHQTRAQGFPSGVALSHHAAMAGGAFPGDVNHHGYPMSEPSWCILCEPSCVSYVNHHGYPMSEPSWHILCEPSCISYVNHHGYPMSEPSWHILCEPSCISYVNPHGYPMSKPSCEPPG
jgi:hypothetical protein